MKQLRLLSLALASVFALSTSTARAADFNDIQVWVGSGANKAAFVVDWNDGKSAESLLWGYRWDGAATGFDMFQAVVNEDSRLFAHLGVFGFGTAVMGMGYDLNNSGGFGVSPSLSFDSGGLLTDTAVASNFNDLRAPLDSNDHYSEGWSSGYWSYYVKSSSASAWGYASTGADLRVLSDGVWDGWSFAPGFSDTAPSESVAAVPEPTSLVLLVSGGLLICVRRKQS